VVKNEKEEQIKKFEGRMTRQKIRALEEDIKRINQIEFLMELETKQEKKSNLRETSNSCTNQNET